MLEILVGAFVMLFGIMIGFALAVSISNGRREDG